MSEFASQTVAQLKELLKGKGLSTEGKKADLVQRLQATEGATDLLPIESEVVADTTPTIEAADATVETAAPLEPVVADEPTLTVIQPAPKEEPKVLTAEERKQLAVELLQKKVQRAVKYGDDAAAEAAKKDLARVEKFGVELGTALAAEIGLVDQSLGNGYKKKFNKDDKNKNRNRNKKGKGKVSKENNRRTR